MMRMSVGKRNDFQEWTSIHAPLQCNASCSGRIEHENENENERGNVAKLSELSFTIKINQEQHS
jgi:hypothetical protein